MAKGTASRRRLETAPPWSAADAMRRLADRGARRRRHLSAAARLRPQPRDRRLDLLDYSRNFACLTRRSRNLTPTRVRQRQPPATQAAGTRRHRLAFDAQAAASRALGLDKVSGTSPAPLADAPPTFAVASAAGRRHSLRFERRFRTPFCRRHTSADEAAVPHLVCRGTLPAEVRAARLRAGRAPRPPRRSLARRASHPRVDRSPPAGRIREISRRPPAPSVSAHPCRVAARSGRTHSLRCWAREEDEPVPAAHAALAHGRPPAAGPRPRLRSFEEVNGAAAVWSASPIHGGCAHTVGDIVFRAVRGRTSCGQEITSTRTSRRCSDSSVLVPRFGSG
jgi:hypothetical protein